jgi:hypothetical protein
MVSTLSRGDEPVPSTPLSGQHSPVETLRRWETSGAVWQVASRTPTGLTISLLTCNGGEEVGRLVSSDPELLRFVGTRSGSEE